MLFWIYDVSTTTLVVFFAALFVGFTWLGLIFIRPWLRLFIGSRPGTNELVGYILGSHGVFYGILLGLLSVAAYQNFSTVESNVEQESATLGSMYRIVSMYPEPLRTHMQDSLRDYTRWLIDEAWPQQQRGIIPTAGSAKTTQFQNLLYAFEPQGTGQESLHNQALEQFIKLVELRRLRLLSVTKGIPPILWYVVILGAIVNIVLIWCFEMRLFGQILLGGMLSFFVAAVIAMIAAMDYPFRGQVSVSPQSFQQVYDSLMKNPQPASVSTSSTFFNLPSISALPSLKRSAAAYPVPTGIM